MGDFFEGKITEITDRAALEVSGVQFVRGYIHRNMDTLGEGRSDEQLYSSVTHALRNVEEVCISSDGSLKYSTNSNPIEVELGLAALVPLSKNKSFGTLVPTEEGKGVVEEYRAARGLVSLAGARKERGSSSLGFMAIKCQ